MNEKLPTRPIAERFALVVALVLYLILSVLYLLAIPTGESPDEPGHLQCIEQVSILGQLPRVEPRPEGDPWWSRGKIISGRMCYHMPLYYLVAGGLQKVVAEASSESIHYEFPPINQNFGPSPALFIQPVKTSFWTYTEPFHLLALRLFSVVLGSVTIFASYIIARRLVPHQPSIASFAALLTAVWPQFVYLSRSLNNDALATALAAVVLIILLDVGKPKRFVWAALLSVLALFTKLSVVFTVFTVVLVWLGEFWKFPTRRKQYLRYLPIWAAVFVSGLLFLFFVPILREHITQSSNSFAGLSESVRTWSYWQEVLRLTASSGWVRFGWMSVASPQNHAYIWWLLLLGTAIFGFTLIVRAETGANGRFKLTICVIWLMFLVLSYLQINLNRLQPQFRFLLATIPILTTLSAAGWIGILKPNYQVMRIGMVSIIASLFFYNIWVINSIVRQAYLWW